LIALKEFSGLFKITLYAALLDINMFLFLKKKTGWACLYPFADSEAQRAEGIGIYGYAAYQFFY
jgi:hypothetical protein